ncbi:MAG: hypothetical protein QOJ67_2629, partial [Acidimicrobiaceae bacterium]
MAAPYAAYNGCVKTTVQLASTSWIT